MAQSHFPNDTGFLLASQFFSHNHLQIYSAKDMKQKATQILFPFPCNKENLSVWFGK